MAIDQDKITADSFFNGTVKVYQSMDGYRFSIDAVLLAAAVRTKPGDRVMDIGTGCGIVPILMAYRHPDIQITGVEIQRPLAHLAEKNVAANQMDDCITIVNHDVCHLKNEMIGGTVDWIVSNPPYRAADSGRINPNAERARARHEIHLNLRQLMQASRKCLRTGGNFVVIYPSDRMVDLFFEMRSAGIEPKWMQCIQSRKGDAARLVLVKGRMRGKPGLKVAQPIIIYDADGKYTDTIEQMMTP